MNTHAMLAELNPALTCDVLHGTTVRHRISVDTLLYGKIAVMSTGFQYVDAVLSLVRENDPARNCYLITLSGLLGEPTYDSHGHASNASKWMKGFLTYLPPCSRLVTFTSILPTQACVVVSIPDDHMHTDWQNSFHSYAEHCRKALKTPAVVLTIEKCETTEHALTLEMHQTIMLIINEIPDGVQMVSAFDENLPTLSYSLVAISHRDDKLHFRWVVRAANAKTLQGSADGVKHLFRVLGCNVTLGYQSDSWIHNPESLLVVAAQEAFRDIGIEVESLNLHCCLELTPKDIVKA